MKRYVSEQKTPGEVPGVRSAGKQVKSKIKSLFQFGYLSDYLVEPGIFVDFFDKRVVFEVVGRDKF